MIASYYGKEYSMDYLRERCYVDREGVSLLGISEAAESIGFKTFGAKIDFDTLVEDVPLPCIVHWKQNHFVVVHKINHKKVWVADPEVSKRTYSKEEFMGGFAPDQDEEGNQEGVILVLEPTEEFNKQKGNSENRSGFTYLFKHILQHKDLLFQLSLGLLVGSILQLIFPFLTQAIVDYGIDKQDLNFIYIILIAQLMLFFSQTAVSFIRSWILLHIGMRINITLISDFLIKLMKLPLRFFDIKLTGDILQRIGDHRRVELFLTSTTLNTIFSILTIFIFGIVLLVYNWLIFLIFILATIFYIIWILFFLRRRKILDHLRFEKQSENHNVIIELIGGMHEIKLHNAETQKRWQWETIQAALYKVGIKSLALGQYQLAGANFINEFKNILISFIAAKAVIDGNMSLGMMLAVQYIIGQLNGPIQEFMGFIQIWQDAKISLERLGEIHDREDEEDIKEKSAELPNEKFLQFENVSFKYGGGEAPWVLKNINLFLPEGKTTAIVGTSGSGKTTLLKLLLNFYSPNEGNVKLGNVDLKTILNQVWRNKCGVVMQDGYIFSDSIANNITLGATEIDVPRLLKSVQLANIKSFIESLPLTYNTKIGKEGIGLSQGQKQRLLIARAIYKNPDYLFFDEATNALDAYNELIIMENLEEFFKEKTVVVVAHRLSTVKNADNIVVIENGEIVEQGTHEELSFLKGAYYHLVKNQLDLGS